MPQQRLAGKSENTAQPAYFLITLRMTQIYKNLFQKKNIQKNLFVSISFNYFAYTNNLKTQIMIEAITLFCIVRLILALVFEL